MKLDFKKTDGLIPAIIQDEQTGVVLMLGYMNEAAYNKTIESGKVTFYSRTRQRLWIKGETSGNYLYLKECLLDCDSDTLLIKVKPAGPVCHTGTDTCFKETNKQNFSFIYQLEDTIRERKEKPLPNSYTNHLFEKGINKIAQKVGEEATEVVIDAVTNNNERLKEETADLLYHLFVMLSAQGLSVDDITEVLRKRHAK